MRKLPKPTEQEINEGPQTVSFQIANGNARQGCILQTNFSTKVEAPKYLLTKWPTIEKMARDALATGIFEDDKIKLVMVPPGHAGLSVPDACPYPRADA